MREECNDLEFRVSQHYFSLGGMKRLVEPDLDKILEYDGFLNLPPEIQSSIILMTFRYKIMSVKEWSLLQKMKHLLTKNPAFGQMIDERVIPSLHYIDKLVIMDLMYSGIEDEIPKMKGLRKMKIPGYVHISEWNQFLPNLPNLRTLDLSSRYTDDHNDEERLTIYKLTNLTKLTVGGSTTDEDVEGLINLTKLRIVTDRVRISDASVSRLTNLTELYFRAHFVRTITSQCLERLTKLQKLSLIATGEDVPEDYTSGLTSLTFLNLRGNDRINNDAVSGLINLLELNLSAKERIHPIITNQGLVHLINLTKLNLGRNEMINSIGIAPLVNLRDLNLSGGGSPVRTGLAKLTNLTRLNLDGNDQIENEHIFYLTTLKSLILYRNENITYKGIKRLTNLEHLAMDSGSVVYGHFPGLFLNLRKVNESGRIYHFPAQ